MASEWIKFDVSLPEKREVLAITLALGWDETALTVGKLLLVWRWFDQHAVDGVDSELTMDLLDRIVGTPGFSKAMCKAGWLLEIDGGLALPNFDRHNGKSAKDRALTAKRNAKLRASQGGTEAEIADSNADIVTMPSPRKEKKIKEKITSTTNSKTNTNATANPTATPTAASDDVLLPDIDLQLASDFKAMRQKLRAPITKTAIDGMRREAAKAGLSLEAAIRICCERGWRGFKAEWEQGDDGNLSSQLSRYASPKPPKFDPVEYVNRNRIDIL
ncbi:MAG TPA: hypothetical protein VNW52_13080 [Burkholderiaceae bacterium]|jgi:hypothetical protein|nr:hypothetical protein [Burkholderiaceae bacterium]